MAKREPKTVEQLQEGFLRMLLKMKQNQTKLATGEITNQDLARRAMDMAEDQFRKNAERHAEVVKASDNVRLTNDEIEEYRQEQMTKYQDSYEWTEANDFATLINLVELETQMYVIRHDLQMPKLSAGERQKLFSILLDMIEKHAGIQQKLGIDKKSRDNQRANASPMEKFEGQIMRFHKFMKERLDKFPAEADNVGTEKDLRELIRYRTGWDFVIVDAIIRNVKRINGLEPTVEQYD